MHSITCQLVNLPLPGFGRSIRVQSTIYFIKFIQDVFANFTHLLPSYADFIVMLFLSMIRSDYHQCMITGRINLRLESVLDLIPIIKQ